VNSKQQGVSKAVAKKIKNEQIHSPLSPLPSCPAADGCVQAFTANIPAYDAPCCQPETLTNENYSVPLLLERIMGAGDSAFAQGDFKSALKAYELLGRHFCLFQEKMELKGALKIKWEDADE
jgi:hypothetical protein